MRKLSENVDAVAGGYEPQGRNTLRGRRSRWPVSVAVFALVLTAGGCTDDGSSSLADEFPTLSIGAVSYPEPIAFESYFREINIAGETFELPFQAQDLVDAGWAYHHSTPDAFDGSVADLDGPVMPFYSTTVTLVPAGDPSAYDEGRSVTVTLINPTELPVPVRECDVWAVRVAEGFDTEPYPGVTRGIDSRELAAVLGLTSDGSIPAESTEYVVSREWLSSEERSDLSGSSGMSDIDIRAASVAVEVRDGVTTGGYAVRYAPYTTMTGGYVIEPRTQGYPYRADISRCDNLNHTWLLPSDLSSAVTIAGGRQVLASGWAYVQGGLSQEGSHIDGAAMYSIDGNVYAMGATNEPSCSALPEKGIEEAEQHVFAELDASLVDVEPTRTLLWDDQRSSAGMLIYRGAGLSTGNDSMQVVVNYCDWEHGTRLTFLYSLLSHEPGVKITDGAANLLLTVASDATRSITFSHQG